MFQNFILSLSLRSQKVSAQKEVTRLLAAHSHDSAKVSKTGNTFSSIQHLTSAIGVVAIAILVGIFCNPAFADKFRAFSPIGSSTQASKEIEKALVPNLSMLMATPQLISQANAGEIDTINDDASTENNYKFIGNQRQQALVTHWLSKRYRVANDAIDMLVSAAYLTAKDTKLDPLLILSVIAIESRFNPFSESPVGAQGLMQVMAKVHQEKFSDLGGVKAALNPVANIKVGAMILKDYIKSTGSVEAALKRYVGAAENETDGGYGSLVLAEYKRLKEVAAGKTVSIFSTSAPKATMLVKPQDNNVEKSGSELTQNKASTHTIDTQVAGTE
jgi:soluble lytic murein transglycosylase-like protein